MIARRNAAWLLLVLSLVTACTGGASPAPSGGGAASAAPSLAPSGGGALTVPPSPASGGGGTGGTVAPGGDLCGLLGPGDFAAVGVAGAGAAKENNPDANNAYCVYAGTSGGTGGVELDAFLAGSRADSEAGFISASAPMVTFGNIAQTEVKAAFPDADGAALRTDIPGPYAGIAIWKGKLVFDIAIPTTDSAKDQLISLAKLVLQRASGLTE